MQTLPIPLPQAFHLLLAPRRLGRELMNTLAARLALVGPVRVLDGGNAVDPYAIARQVRRATPNVTTVLKQMHLARAFTCYQMAALLSQQEDTPVPLLALDLLATFYDENVPLDERLRLLAGCLEDLRRLSRQAPLVISATPAPANAPGDELLARLEAASQHTWRLEAPGCRRQPRLL